MWRDGRRLPPIDETGMTPAMSLLNSRRPEFHSPRPYPVFRGPDNDHEQEGRRVAILVDRWLMSLEECLPGSPAALKLERTLHEAIKSGPFFGKVLTFAGLNLWVDEWTSTGRVELQESISL